MKDWLANIAVGQRLFWVSGPRGCNVLTCVVKRLTPTQIIVASGETEVRFRRKNGEAVSGDKWYRSEIRPHTDAAAKKAWLCRIVRNRLQRIEASIPELDIDALEVLYAGLRAIHKADDLA